MHALLADLVVYVHFSYVLFAVGGEALVILGWVLEGRRVLPRALRFTRSPGFRLAHLGATVLVALEALAGVLCPLTGWEYALRRLAGQRVQSEIPFMSRLVHRVIFYDLPAWVFTLTYVLFALLVAVSALAYPPRRRSRCGSESALRRSAATGEAPAQSPKGHADHSSSATGTRAAEMPAVRHRLTRIQATLRDGTRVLIRPLRPGDRGELQKGFGLLSLASRRFRFISPIRRLTQPQLEQLTTVDQVDNVALGARDEGRRDRPGIAVARFVRLGQSAGSTPGSDSGPVVAEFAVTVVDEYQGRGLGTLLLRLLLREAAAVGVERLRGYVLQDNAAMLGALKGFLTESRRDAGNVLCIELPVGANLEAAGTAPRQGRPS